jgi:hypothetical protein
MRWGAACLAIASLAACAKKDAAPADTTAAAPAAAAAPNVVTVTATDYAFDAPAQIPAGVTTFKFINQGKEVHHMALARIDSGKTADDVVAAFKAAGPTGKPPEWIRDAGGPNAPPPGGGESNVTQTLEAGTYALLCFVDIPGKVPHFMKGMAKTLIVTPSTASAPEPTSDLTLTLADYGFNFSAPPSVGRHTVRVENSGPQPHEVLLVQLVPGKTMQDLAAWVANPTGPAPARPMGGTVGIPSGGHVFFDTDLTPGDYGLICFIPDAKDGKSHAEHGMVQQFKVG